MATIFVFDCLLLWARSMTARNVLIPGRRAVIGKSKIRDVTEIHRCYGPDKRPNSKGPLPPGEGGRRPGEASRNRPSSGPFGPPSPRGEGPA
jgi:hypothetical protein